MDLSVRQVDGFNLIFSDADNSETSRSLTKVTCHQMTDLTLSKVSLLTTSLAFVANSVLPALALGWPKMLLSGPTACPWALCRDFTALTVALNSVVMSDILRL